MIGLSPRGGFNKDEYKFPHIGKNIKFSKYRIESGLTEVYGKWN